MNHGARRSLEELQSVTLSELWGGQSAERDEAVADVSIFFRVKMDGMFHGSAVNVQWSSLLSSEFPVMSSVVLTILPILQGDSKRISSDLYHFNPFYLVSHDFQGGFPVGSGWFWLVSAPTCRIVPIEVSVIFIISTCMYIHIYIYTY